MNKKKLIPVMISAAILVLIAAFLMTQSNDDGLNILSDVKKGEFVVDITTTGELEAKNSVEIQGPKGLRLYRIWQVTIQEIIDEGSYVKKGDYVARLDASELTNKVSETQIELDKIQSQFIQIQLDTTLQMRQSRDELINLKYEIEDRQMTLDQSQFEPPATIKKAEIEVEKAVRALQQAEENYLIKQRQNVAKMTEVTASLNKQRLELTGLNELIEKFTITAPEDGMLIYYKDFEGTVKTGSQINAWNPVVATLPDLTIMISETYVNEVDIRKISTDQLVEVGLDAFPEKKINGKVIRVANVGEQRPNSDAKVFKVSIELFGTDNMIKPGMTTSNRIITKVYPEALSIPLEALYNYQDSITYVYKKSGINVIKQEVIIGATNSNEVVVMGGLIWEDQIYLTKVKGTDEQEILLIPEMNGKRNPSDQSNNLTAQKL
jgi:HlyD family secretion protein|tara:strand:+ start:5551 stop:6858 length:1308 start_codon:yes stop_codon:yes gene_type:complete